VRDATTLRAGRPVDADHAASTPATIHTMTPTVKVDMWAPEDGAL